MSVRVSIMIPAHVHDKISELALKNNLKKYEVIEKLLDGYKLKLYEKLDLNPERLNKYAWYIFKLVNSILVIKNLILIKIKVFQGLEELVEPLINPEIQSAIEKLEETIEQIESRLCIKLNWVRTAVEDFVRNPGVKNIQKLNDTVVKIIEDLMVKATYEKV